MLIKERDVEAYQWIDSTAIAGLINNSTRRMGTYSTVRSGLLQSLIVRDSVLCEKKNSDD